MANKLEKFERLAERRVSGVIKKLRLIGNLSNKKNYSYTGEHVRQIVEVLENEIRLLKSRFKEETANKSSVFQFKSKRHGQKG